MVEPRPRRSPWRYLVAASVAAALIAVAIILWPRSDHVPSIDQVTPLSSAATTSPPATAAATEAAPLRGWDLIMAQESTGGVLSLRGALEAFSLEFEPLPGVVLPDGLVAGDVPQTDTAMAGVIGHWPELTSAQKSVVLVYLRDVDGASGPISLASIPAASTSRPDSSSDSSLPASARQFGSSGRVLGATEPGPARITLAGLATEALATEAGRLGHTMGELGIGPDDLWVHLAGVDKPGFPAYTWGSPGALDTTNDDTDPVKDDRTGGARQCHIFFSPTIWQHADNVSALSELEIAIVYHEVFHCYQIMAIGHTQLSAADHMPMWIQEGGADWVPVSLLAFAEPEWATWLGKPEKKLEERSYDGFGLYSELRWLGRDMWPEWWTVFQKASAGGMTTATWFDAVTGPFKDTLRDSWGSSYFQSADWGHPWDIEVGGIIHTLAIPVGIDPDDPKPVTIEPYSAFVGVIGAPTGAGVVVITADGPFRVRDSEGTIDQVGATRIGVCLSSDNCKPCPEGSAASTYIGKEPLAIASAAYESPVHLQVSIESREEHCRKPDKPGRPGGGGGGTGEPPPPEVPSRPPARDTGDPHLRTVDGLNYDFQTAGEFIALDGGDGFVLQARHQMLVTRSDVSLVSAVAMSVMGDRVGVSGTGTGLELRVNGVVESISDAHELPKGGRADPERGGVHITWPDGSQVWALPTQAQYYGVNVLVSLSDARIAGARGLLGSSVDGKLVSRDGTAIVPGRPTAGSRAYTDLYRTFGDSWRLTQAESLFDYQPGESTATFDLRQYPDAATSASELSDADRARGEAACKAVRDPELRDACAFDVGLSGDVGLAAGYDVIEAVTSSRGSLTPGASVPATAITQETADTYRLVVDKPTTVYLRHGSGTKQSASGLITWSMITPDGQSHGANTIDEDYGRQDLEPGIYAIRVEAPKGASGTYEFSVLVPAADQRFEITSGTAVGPDRPGAGAGRIARWGDRDLYSFHGRQGGSITLSGTDCGTSPQVISAALYQGNLATEATRLQYLFLDCRASPTSIDLPADGDYLIAVTAEAVGITYADYELRPGQPFDGTYGFRLDQR